MAKRITIILLILLSLIVLFGVFMPSGTIEEASATYHIDLPAHDTHPSTDTGGAVLLPASDKIIVQGVHFNLIQSYLFILGIAFSMLLIFKVDICKKPLFTISYFDNTFCHLIAINAP